MNIGIKQKLYLFIDELMLNSGQYAVFYILLNISKDGSNYFSNTGHTFLIFFLILQTYLLVIFGHKPLNRFLGSLIAPFCYTLIEAPEGIAFILKSGHISFWIFSIITGLLQALNLMTDNSRKKTFYQVSLTITNVFIFIFLYFYLDLILGYSDLLAAGKLDYSDMLEMLEIYNLHKGLVPLLKEPDHIFVILGGIMLAITIAIGRAKIIKLTDKLNSLFGIYVGSKIRDKIVSEQYPSKKDIVTLFSDIRDFTPITENNNPDDVVKMLNIYFSAWAEIIKRHNGIIDKFIGDAIMVFFGLEYDKDAPRRSVLASIEILSSLDSIKKKLKLNALPVINNIGIGINYGSAIIADIGSSDRKNHTIIGDSVNTAARLESECKVFGTSLIISRTVYQSLGEDLKKHFKYITADSLKGKSQKVDIYAYIDK